MINKKVAGVAVKWLLVAAAALYLTASFGFSFWPFDGQNQELVQAQASKNMATATTESAEAAIEVVLDNAEAEKSVLVIVSEAAAVIASTDPQAHPHVTRKVVFDSVCKMAIYAKDPKCAPPAVNEGTE